MMWQTGAAMQKNQLELGWKLHLPFDTRGFPPLCLGHAFFLHQRPHVLLLSPGVWVGSARFFPPTPVSGWVRYFIHPKDSGW